ncbi:N-acetylmuramyl-L-alanine amidase, negative regulator of AmpC, AmpD [Kribbella flavida DSM 17836]|uniref:N-acetylmuramoyl-L-alanine amidase n=1 Tax=Kribbella flavida (strain DSM 17836 / JCM 10339 / NBRC 14399) TaxID=479435 RepID=D2PZI0_KRIFD|nr:N-acetylmuramoyl-L-alanine amidase [Kribbella flavida]ADB33789.1 N-acetylmuramyl-L-alanine amidase, negative regulator of AmpC, AmpD [Kribbella flavida DSM 17836]
MGKTAARVPRLTAVLAVAAAGALAFSALPSNAAQPAPQTGAPSLAEAFRTAATQYDVPRELLVGIGYAESHLDGHNGLPSQANGYGVMHLASNPVNPTLSEAAKITGLPVEQLAKDTGSNILGAAAVLDAYADRAGLAGAARQDLGKWYSVVAQYSHSADGPTARLYTDEVYRIIGQGVGAAGVSIQPKKVTPDRGKYTNVAPLGTRTPSSIAAVDYPGAIWNPASTSNYRVGRTAAISTIVIHVTQGSYTGTISWFKNPASQVSAHYVIRSSDGQVTQMVAEKDTAWHARSTNPYTVGIEHEGWVDQPSWFTDAMYRSSAALTRSIADRRGIPKDRAHIRGHNELPDNDHTDPGPNWNWTYYMQLVNGGTPTSNFTTYGSGVRVRSDARLSAPIVTTLAGPTRVYVTCQKQGDTVTAEGTTNNWWSKLRDQGGFMTNIYIDHPDAKLPGVPICP